MNGEKVTSRKLRVEGKTEYGLILASIEFSPGDNGVYHVPIPILNPRYPGERIMVQVDLAGPPLESRLDALEARLLRAAVLG